MNSNTDRRPGGRRILTHTRLLRLGTASIALLLGAVVSTSVASADPLDDLLGDGGAVEELLGDDVLNDNLLGRNGGDDGVEVFLDDDETVDSLTIDGMIGDDDLVEGANVCIPTCPDADDALLGANAATGEELGHLGAEACLVGSCEAGSVAGDAVALGEVTSDDTPLVGDVNGSACVIGTCNDGDVTADALGMVDLDTDEGDVADEASVFACLIGECERGAEIMDAVLSGDIDLGVEEVATPLELMACVLGNCDIDGTSADGVLVVETGGDVLDDTADVDAGACVLATCSATQAVQDVDPSDDPAGPDGSNEPGDGSDSRGRPDLGSGNAGGDGNDDSGRDAGGRGLTTTTDAPVSQQMPNTGFAPTEDASAFDTAGGHALLVMALAALAAAWAVGMVRIFRKE